MLRAYITHPVTSVESEYAARLRPDKKFEVGSKAFAGEADLGDFLLDDPLGTLDWIIEFAGRRRVRISEDASGSEKTLIVGRIASKEFDRGKFRAGRGREFSISVEDANADLRGIIVHQFIRPAETGRTRVLATLAAYLNGTSSTALNPDSTIYGRASTVIGTTYVQAAGDVMMPAETYDGTDPLTVLRACAEYEDKRLGVYVEDDGSLELYYAPRDETAQLNCTLDISDNPADVDNLTTFGPHWIAGPALHTDTDETVTGLLLIHPDGLTFERRSAAEAIRDRWEEAVYSSRPVASGADEIAKLLDARDEEQPRRQFALRLPASKVHLVKACMRIIVLQAVASAVDSSTAFRIVQVRYAYLSPDGDENQYNVIVTLETPIKVRGTWSGGFPRFRPPPRIEPIPVVGTPEICTNTILNVNDGWYGDGTVGGPGTTLFNGISIGDLSGSVITVDQDTTAGDTIGLAFAGNPPSDFNDPFPLGSSGGYFTGRYTFPEIDAGVHQVVQFRAYNDDETTFPPAIFIFRNSVVGPGTTLMRIDGSPFGSPSAYYDLAIPTDIDVILRFKLHFFGTAMKGKVWKAGELEPDWQVATTRGFATQPEEILAYFNLANDPAVITTVLDEVQWISQDCVEVPTGYHGMHYGPVLVATADGTTSTFTLPSYPGGGYVPGTLDARVNGIYQPTTVVDAAAGTFDFGPDPDAGDVISASWRVPL